MSDIFDDISALARDWNEEEREAMTTTPPTAPPDGPRVLTADEIKEWGKDPRVQNAVRRPDTPRPDDCSTDGPMSIEAGAVKKYAADPLGTDTPATGTNDAAPSWDNSSWRTKLIAMQAELLPTPCTIHHGIPPDGDTEEWWIESATGRLLCGKIESKAHARAIANAIDKASDEAKRLPEGPWHVEEAADNIVSAARVFATDGPCIAICRDTATARAIAAIPAREAEMERLRFCESTRETILKEDNARLRNALDAETARLNRALELVDEKGVEIGRQAGFIAEIEGQNSSLCIENSKLYNENQKLRGIEQREHFLTKRLAERGTELESLRSDNEKMREVLRLVRTIIVEAAATGFNYKDGDWAERLYASQAVTHAALTETE